MLIVKTQKDKNYQKVSNKSSITSNELSSN